MKIKMPCKLCEMSPSSTLDPQQQQKMSSNRTSSSSCNHILDYASPYVPFSSLEQLAIQSNGLFLPQMRDMMLAACLLRGKEPRNTTIVCMGMGMDG